MVKLLGLMYWMGLMYWRINMKEYLCIEDGEKFIIEAKNWEEARETAAMYNAQVIEEMP